MSQYTSPPPLTAHAESSRFVLNIPEYERNSIERVGFQVEAWCVALLPDTRQEPASFLRPQPLVLRGLRQRAELRLPIVYFEKILLAPLEGRPAVEGLARTPREGI